jgi:hypothetical protein
MATTENRQRQEHLELQKVGGGQLGSDARIDLGDVRQVTVSQTERFTYAGDLDEHQHYQMVQVLLAAANWLEWASPDQIVQKVAVKLSATGAPSVEVTYQDLGQVTE